MSTSSMELIKQVEEWLKGDEIASLDEAAFVGKLCENPSIMFNFDTLYFFEVISKKVSDENKNKLKRYYYLHEVATNYSDENKTQNDGLLYGVGVSGLFNTEDGNGKSIIKKEIISKYIDEYLMVTQKSDLKGNLERFIKDFEVLFESKTPKQEIFKDNINKLEIKYDKDTAVIFSKSLGKFLAKDFANLSIDDIVCARSNMLPKVFQSSRANIPNKIVDFIVNDIMSAESVNHIEDKYIFYLKVSKEALKANNFYMCYVMNMALSELNLKDFISRSDRELGTNFLSDENKKIASDIKKKATMSPKDFFNMDGDSKNDSMIPGLHTYIGAMEKADQNTPSDNLIKKSKIIGNIIKSLLNRNNIVNEKLKVMDDEYVDFNRYVNISTYSIKNNIDGRFLYIKHFENSMKGLNNKDKIKKIHKALKARDNRTYKLELMEFAFDIMDGIKKEDGKIGYNGNKLFKTCLENMLDIGESSNNNSDIQIKLQSLHHHNFITGFVARNKRKSLGLSEKKNLYGLIKQVGKDIESSKQQIEGRKRQKNEHRLSELEKENKKLQEELDTLRQEQGRDARHKKHNNQGATLGQQLAALGEKFRDKRRTGFPPGTGLPPSTGNTPAGTKTRNVETKQVILTDPILENMQQQFVDTVRQQCQENNNIEFKKLDNGFKITKCNAAEKTKVITTFDENNTSYLATGADAAEITSALIEQQYISSQMNTEKTVVIEDGSLDQIIAFVDKLQKTDQNYKIKLDKNHKDSIEKNLPKNNSEAKNKFIALLGKVSVESTSADAEQKPEAITNNTPSRPRPP